MTYVYWSLLGLIWVAIAIVIMAELMNVAWAHALIDRVARRPPRTWIALQKRTWFRLDDLAFVEKYFPQLKKVIVLSARVDEPTRFLADAVRDNFREGVMYEFFVPRAGNDRSQLEAYHAWFTGLFNEAKEHPSSKNALIQKLHPDSLTSINVLDLEWSNVPYVFYVFGTERKGETATIAFRGTDPGTGISREYVRIDPEETKAIIELCARASIDFREAMPHGGVSVAKEIPSSKVVWFRSRNAEIVKP